MVHIKDDDITPRNKCNKGVIGESVKDSENYICMKREHVTGRTDKMLLLTQI